jgi:hypothetical protein
MLCIIGFFPEVYCEREDKRFPVPKTLAMKQHMRDVKLNSALAGGEWLTSRSGRFTPRKDPRYPFYRRVGGPQSRSGRCDENNPAFPGIEPQSSNLQPGHNTDRITGSRFETQTLDYKFRPLSLHHKLRGVHHIKLDLIRLLTCKNYSITFL